MFFSSIHHFLIKDLVIIKTKTCERIELKNEDKTGHLMMPNHVLLRFFQSLIGSLQRSLGDT